MTFHTRRHLIGAVFGVGLVSWSLVSVAQMRPQSSQISAIENYTLWHEVTQKPVEMEPRVSTLCMPPSFAPPMKQGTQGPHQKKFIRVYVNAVAKEQMTTRKEPRFPVGSVIVKQKLPLIHKETQKGSIAAPQQISLKPELLTVMIKREKGYDAANGDWEYMVTDGPGKKVAERGQLKPCQSCHRPFQKSDYIVRSYLPKSVEAALRGVGAPTTPAKPLSKAASKNSTP